MGVVPTRRTWNEGGTVAIETRFRYWLIAYETSAQPNRMRNRDVQAPYLSLRSLVTLKDYHKGIANMGARWESGDRKGFEG